MELFLVRGIVVISHYMNDEKITEEHTRLVKADSAEGAEAKFTDYWERRTSAYSVDYWVKEVEAFYTIE